MVTNKEEKKRVACRFCNRVYMMEFARNNHETNCINNPKRGLRPKFTFDGRKYKCVGHYPG